jgi:protein-S-isoprenylcysteine O-methyltransferase Ste14
MRVLDLKVPPLAAGALLAALMWLVSRLVPGFNFVFPGREFLALILAIAGAMIILLGVASFRRAKTTINPMKPELSSSLVISGIYKLSRNPMYLGFLLVLAGWAVFLSNALAFVFVAAFIFYMNRFQIEPEEKALAGKFGQEFLDYKSRVRRWL